MRETDLQHLEAEYLRDKIDYQAWIQNKPAELWEEQKLIQDILRRHGGARHFGKNCFIARGAKVFTSRFSMGNDSYIAAGAIVRGDVIIGNNCSVNPYAHIAGVVRIGSDVRIASLTSIYGFNHGFSRTDVPISKQPSTHKGVTIGDGCWLGANAVILDGVTVGAHSIVSAGAVVTRTFPEYSIIGGNPGRLIRSRLSEENQRAESS